MENQMIEINNIAKQLKIRADIRAKNIDNLLNWKRIEGYDNYSVSNRGEVRNDYTDRILKGANCEGYLRVSLSKDGKNSSHLIHRLVSNAFLKNPQNKMCVDHINNDKRDNRICNLRFATPEENQRNAQMSLKNTSNVKGVSYHKAAKKWIARISYNNKRHCIGFFETLEEAKQARQLKAKELFGEYINKCELII